VQASKMLYVGWKGFPLSENKAELHFTSACTSCPALFL
jgi:hypothetical protein